MDSQIVEPAVDELTLALSNLAVARQQLWENSPVAVENSIAALVKALSRLQSVNPRAALKVKMALKSLRDIHSIEAEASSVKMWQSTVKDSEIKLLAIATEVGSRSEWLTDIDDALDRQAIVLAGSAALIEVLSMHSGLGLVSYRQKAQDMRVPADNDPSNVLTWIQAWNAMAQVCDTTLPWEPMPRPEAASMTG